jgi:CSLREA domain-containing protein
VQTRINIVAIIVSFMVLGLAGRTLAVEEIELPQAILVVNTTSDTDDGFCDATNCSLREAIKAANDTIGPNTITFNIPASDSGCDAGGICTLRPITRFPPIIDDDTTIDGFSQPGAIPNSNPVGQGLNAVYKIVLDGSLVEDFPAGIDIYSSNNLVRGLVIQNFNDGISVVDGDENYIEGNYIGTNALGTGAAGNRCHGISISSFEGGVGSFSNVVGGSSPQARNLISANGCVGVGIGPGENNKVQGNIIGADSTGTLPLPNARDGVYIFNAAKNNLIGGQAAGEANLIAYNIENGVNVYGGYGADGNTISRNSIHSNTYLGIALLNGGNAGLAAPVITAANSPSVSGTACNSCTIEVFSDADGEGAIYEGTTMADSGGAWTLLVAGGASGPNLTATATDSNGNTSQFSEPVILLVNKVYVPIVLK